MYLQAKVIETEDGWKPAFYDDVLGGWVIEEDFVADNEYEAQQVLDSWLTEFPLYPEVSYDFA